MDGLLSQDWASVASGDGDDEDAVGFGRAQFLQQDGGGALLKNQLIPADVLEVQSHIRKAQRLEHPAGQR